MLSKELSERLSIDEMKALRAADDQVGLTTKKPACEKWDKGRVSLAASQVDALVPQRSTQLPTYSQTTILRGAHFKEVHGLL